MPTPLPSAELKKIKKYWQEAVVTMSDPNTQFLAAGRNFRIGVFSALKAAFHAAKAIFEVNKAIFLGEIMPWDVFGIAESAYHAVTNVLEALSESLSALEYVACIVLGSNEKGLSAKQLEEKLHEFLDADLADRGKRAWYLGLTESRLSDAKDELDSTIPFHALIEKLNEKKFLEKSGNKWKFKSRHVDWTFKL